MPNSQYGRKHQARKRSSKAHKTLSEEVKPELADLEFKAKADTKARARKLPSGIGCSESSNKTNTKPRMLRG